MKTRITALAVGFACVLAAACGTRVDESVTTGQTVLVPAGQALTPGGGATGSTVPSASGGSGTGASSGSGAGVTGAGSGSGSGAGSDATGTGTGTGSDAEGSGAIRPASGEPVVLGAVGTRSGLVGAALDNAFRGLVVWQEWVNSHGGLAGRPVRIIYVDDTADPARHAAAVRRLILEEGVVAFIGNVAPFTFSAGVPLLEEHGMAAIGGDGGEAAWFTSPMAFPINGQTVSRSRPAAKWVLANRPERKVAVFYVSEADAPRQLAANFMDEWRRGGGEVVVDAGVSLATPDFTAEIIEARDSGAELVYIVLEKAACNRFFDAAIRQRFHPIFLSTACTIDTFRDAAEVTAGRTYALHAARPVLGDSAAENEVREAVERFDPTLYADGAFMFGWLAGTLLEEAMALPGAEPTTAGIVDALHRMPTTDLGGLTPPQSWPPGPHPEGQCGLVSLFDNDRLNLQTPDFVC